MKVVNWTVTHRLTSTLVKQRQAMSNNTTTCSLWSNSSMSGTAPRNNYREEEYYPFLGTFAGSIIIAVLSPVAGVGNAYRRRFREQLSILFLVD